MSEAFIHTVLTLTKQRGSSRSPTSTLVSRECTLVLTSTGVCPCCSRALSLCGSLHTGKLLTTSIFSLSLSLCGCLSLCLTQAVQQVKACSNTPPTAWTGCLSLLLDQRGRSRGSERGGNTEEKKKKQHDSACFNRLAYTAFTLNTLTHE